MPFRAIALFLAVLLTGCHGRQAAAPSSQKASATAWDVQPPIVTVTKTFTGVGNSLRNDRRTIAANKWFTELPAASQDRIVNALNEYQLRLTDKVQQSGQPPTYRFTTDDHNAVKAVVAREGRDSNQISVEAKLVAAQRLQNNRHRWYEFNLILKAEESPIPIGPLPGGANEIGMLYIVELDAEPQL